MVLDYTNMNGPECKYQKSYFLKFKIVLHINHSNNSTFICELYHLSIIYLYYLGAAQASAAGGGENGWVGGGGPQGHHLQFWASKIQWEEGKNTGGKLQGQYFEKCWVKNRVKWKLLLFYDIPIYIKWISPIVINLC